MLHGSLYQCTKDEAFGRLQGRILIKHLPGISNMIVACVVAFDTTWRFCGLIG
jgi:hypothetical protein